MSDYDVIVVGAGAAGLAAAVAAASCGDRVLVLERMNRAGKKILATGNGRCNLMNHGDPVYPGGGSLARAVLKYCGVQEQTRFWNDLGLRLREEQCGRVYPVTGQAATVLETLWNACRMREVRFVFEETVSKIQYMDSEWHVSGRSSLYTGGRLVIAGGGSAQPKLGSDGSCYSLLQSVGHSIRPVRPALTQIETEKAPIAGLNGVRVKGDIAVLEHKRLIHAETGELLFTEYGVSGVCAMQCARWVRPGCIITLNFLHGMGFASRDALAEELEMRVNRWWNLPAADLLTGICVQSLAAAVYRMADIRCKDRKCGTLTDRELTTIVDTLISFNLNALGVKGFEHAQITVGGAAWREFDPKTMSSLKACNLHAAGEVIDVDGDCGGFNLMFAFGSGILAGLNGRKSEWRIE